MGDLGVGAGGAYDGSDGVGDAWLDRKSPRWGCLRAALVLGRKMVAELMMGLVLHRCWDRDDRACDG